MLQSAMRSLCQKASVCAVCLAAELLGVEKAPLPEWDSNPEPVAWLCGEDLNLGSLRSYLDALARAHNREQHASNGNISFTSTFQVSHEEQVGHIRPVLHEEARFTEPRFPANREREAANIASLGTYTSAAAVVSTQDTTVSSTMSLQLPIMCTAASIPNSWSGSLSPCLFGTSCCAYAAFGRFAKRSKSIYFSGGQGGLVTAWRT